MNLALKLDVTESESETLTPQMIARAWSDRRYRATLSPSQLLKLPGHPAGQGRLLHLVEDLHETNCSSDNCSSSNCSSDNCSSSNCSSDNCSSSNCSSNNCSSSNCSGNACSANACGEF